MTAVLRRRLTTEPRIDGVFTGGDVLAMHAVLALSQMGRRVPEDIRVAGFDDIALAAYFRPSLTTVRQAIAELGVAIVDALAAQLARAAAPPAQLTAALVVRESSG